MGTTVNTVNLMLTLSRGRSDSSVPDVMFLDQLQHQLIWEMGLQRHLIVDFPLTLSLKSVPYLLSLQQPLLFQVVRQSSFLVKNKHKKTECHFFISVLPRHFHAFSLEMKLAENGSCYFHSVHTSYAHP